MRWLIATLAVISLCSCATGPERGTALQKAQLHDAQVAEVICGKAHVAEVDDRISDAATVAYVLSLRCSAEYDAATEKATLALMKNDSQDDIWRRSRATKQDHVDDFLQIVMWYRQKQVK